MNPVAPSNVTQSLRPIGEELSSSAPVFVDTTGRRRRRVRLLGIAVAAICLLYIGLFSFSLFTGSSVGLNTVLPEGGQVAVVKTAAAADAVSSSTSAPTP